MILGATIRLKDEFSGTLGKAARETTGLTGKMRILGHMVAKPTIRVKDDASATISKVKGSLMSLRTVAGLALAGLGINELKEATVGAAMTWETQAVSMEHWLKGNKTLAKEATGWLEDFAAATPFEMTDLFPAMTRGIGVSDGNLKRAERLVTLAADMAALTPGKSISDAMEALADAKMGEFERLKEFNMKMTQEEFRALGGFGGMLSKAEATFAGGAEKLSQTAIGKISTITDNMKSMFRSTGMGILDSMKPRLDKITSWFDKNKETVARWKDNLITFGREASNALFTRFESTFSYLRKKYLDNPEFQKLDFSAKVSLLASDLSGAFDSWIHGPGGQKAASIGAELGKTMITSMASAGLSAIGESKLLALLLGGYIGLMTPGPIELKAVIALSIAAEPWVKNFVQWAQSNSTLNTEMKMNSMNQTLKELETTPSNQPVIKESSIGRRQTGGFIEGVGNIFRSIQRGVRGYASGLPYVPYDNYPVNLHRGEEVLTRAEADQRRRDSNNGGNNFYVTIYGANMSTDQVLDELEERLLRVAANMGR